jgi:hypothetical protein
VEDGYEYGGGGPEYMFDGEISGAVDMVSAATDGCFW